MFLQWGRHIPRITEKICIMHNAGGDSLSVVWNNVGSRLRINLSFIPDRLV